MNDNRRQILDMLAQGKINAAEAEGLIAALERQAGATLAPDPSGGRRLTNTVDFFRGAALLPVLVLLAAVSLPGSEEPHGTPSSQRMLVGAKVAPISPAVGEATSWPAELSFSKLGRTTEEAAGRPIR